MSIRFAVFVVTAALACGCGALQVDYDDAPDADDGGADASARRPIAPEDRRKAAREEQPDPIAALKREVARVRQDYKISAADLLGITVYEVQEMNRKVRVNASGMIYLPLVGAVDVGGKTLSAAQNLIEKKLAAYVIRPQVTLFIEEYGNRRFSVMGEVQRPGTYPIPTESRMTVLEAISTAGGFTPVAAQDRARVVRYANGESWIYTIDVRAITREGQKEKDMILEPNDVVFVPQSLF